MAYAHDCENYPEEFFKAIFGNTVETHGLCIEFLFRRKKGEGAGKTEVQFKWYRSLRKLEADWPYVRAMTEGGWDVDFALAPRVRNGFLTTKGHDLPENPILTSLWADIDVGKGKPFSTWKDAFAHLRKVKPFPGVLVQSGRGLHPYYPIAPTKVSEGQAQTYLKTIAQKLHAEVGAPTQIKRRMRVPNTLNHKHDEPVRFFIPKGSKRFQLERLEGMWGILGQKQVAEGDAVNAKVDQAKFLEVFTRLVRNLKPDADGKWAHGLCPFRHGARYEENPSFWLNLKTGRWGCHACRKEGWPVDLLGPALLSTSSTPSVTWTNLPAFDPALVKRTKWLKKDFIPAKNITLVYGARGSFKSSYLLWTLRNIGKRRRVLYLDYENPPDVLKRLDSDLRLHLNANSTFKIWDRFGDAVPPRPGDGALEELVREALKETKRSPVLVFDSWGSLLKPGDGGETTGQVAPIYAHLRRLCDLGATIIVLDHSRKYFGDRIYGGEDKEAKSDVIHNFIMHDDATRPTQPTLEVKSFLKRHAPKGVTSFSVRPISKKDDEGVWHIHGFEPCVDHGAEEGKKHRDIMRELVKEHPESSQEELVKFAGLQLSRRKAREVLKKGVERGYWEMQKGSHGKIVYKLTD